MVASVVLDLVICGGLGLLYIFVVASLGFVFFLVLAERLAGKSVS